MPGWYIHMDVARKSLTSLPSNSGAASVFGSSSGPDANTLIQIAKNNPAYVALGSIGPDIFFLLPDFKPPFGTMLWGAANTIRRFYEWWDENFLGPYEDQLGPIAMNTADEIDAITGGLASQLSRIFSGALRFLWDTAIVLISRQYDLFSILGSGVPQGYDEQVFFWSDMLHYRKTYEFAAHLWKKASDPNNPNPRFQAYALGWMSHLATDVTGHSFVNEKSGGPYRLHWQRHHLIENHMDAKVYDSEHGQNSIYQMIANAALHLWIAFNPDDSSRTNFFDSQPGPDYKTGDDTPSILDRNSKLNVDSNIPEDLANFLSVALKEVYNHDIVASTKGQCAEHPTIINDLKPGSDGYADAEDIKLAYFWLYKYVKHTTTDYFKLRRPPKPEVFNLPPFPSPPGTGESDPGPGKEDHSAWHNFLEVLLAIIGWIEYIIQVVAWAVSAIISLFTSAGTYPVRELLYENFELPLYNAWLALHWYLSMTGFVSPMQQEINPGLVTMGVSVGDVWGSVWSALDDLAGGLITPVTGSEPSGSSAFDPDKLYPRDEVVDPQGWISAAIKRTLNVSCGDQQKPRIEAPSEFMRPWLWPKTDNEGDPVPMELPISPASPYQVKQDATDLMKSSPGNQIARHDFEGANNEKETLSFIRQHLHIGEHLGDPVDYTGYVIAWLTRDNPNAVVNFNLDSDRGYGYLCWDWIRSETIMAIPDPFKNESNNRAYHAPLRPAAGWCDLDIPSGTSLPAIGDPGRPTKHDATKGGEVRIRYIDREEKFE